MWRQDLPPNIYQVDLLKNGSDFSILFHVVRTEWSQWSTRKPRGEAAVQADPRNLGPERSLCMWNSSESDPPKAPRSGFLGFVDYLGAGMDFFLIPNFEAKKTVLRH